MDYAIDTKLGFKQFRVYGVLSFESAQAFCLLFGVCQREFVNLSFCVEVPKLKCHDCRGPRPSPIMVFGLKPGTRALTFCSVLLAKIK